MLATAHWVLPVMPGRLNETKCCKSIVSFELHNHPCVARHIMSIHSKKNAGNPWFKPWVGKILWRREWIPTPVFLSGEFHGERSLAGDSSWVTKNWTRLSDCHFHYSKKTDLFKTLRKLLTAIQLSGGGIRIQAKLSDSEAWLSFFLTHQLNLTSFF